MNGKHALSALLLTAMISGCGGGGGGGGAPGDTIAPTVSATTPQDNATGVNGEPLITVTFSEAMDPATINATTFLLTYSGGSVSGDVSLSADGLTASFTPSALLLAETAYSARLTTGARDLSGNALATEHVWAFTTEKARKAFITSATGTANLGSWTDAGGQSGLAAGDAICQARAQAAGLSGTFKAWLSDETNDAYCRVHNLSGKKAANCGQATLPAAAGPWVRPKDGAPFAGTIDELTGQGKVYVPLRYDENGNPAPLFGYFTATDPEGVLLTSSGRTHCANWTSASTDWVDVGARDGTTDLWTASGSSQCGESRALACLQVGTGKGPGFPPVSTTGKKKAFVTSVMGNGNLGSWADAGDQSGLDAGDAICRARAQAAGLANAAKFKAWLSDGSTDAKDRITSNGPWVRPDGMPIAEGKADLIDGELFTAITLTETGSYVGNYAVWTGTNDDGSRAANTCAGWTNGTNSAQGTHGVAASASSGWSNGGALQCNFTAARLYCLEDD